MGLRVSYLHNTCRLTPEVVFASDLQLYINDFFYLKNI